LGFLFLNRDEWNLPYSIEAFLRSALITPTCCTFLGAGVSLLYAQDMLRAEQALAEANFLDPYNADVWGYLAKLCLINERVEEANRCPWLLSYYYCFRCFEMCLKCGSDNITLLRDIAQDFLTHSLLHQAETACGIGVDIEQLQGEPPKSRQESGGEERSSATTPHPSDQSTPSVIRMVLADVLFARGDWEAATRSYKDSWDAVARSYKDGLDPAELDKNKQQQRHILKQLSECFGRTGKWEEEQQVLALLANDDELM
jgi:hypothetical protein